MITKIFPSLLIALDVAAAVVYAWHGDWRRHADRYGDLLREG